jgi:serine/threonine protein kinase
MHGSDDPAKTADDSRVVGANERMTSSEPTDSTPSGLTPEMMLCVNRHCDRREAQWRAIMKNRPLATAGAEFAAEPESLGQFLTSVPVAEQAASVPELVLIDLAYRAEAGLPLVADWFRQQIPWLEAKWLNDQIVKFRVQAPVAIEDQMEAPDVHQLGDYVITGTLGRGGMGHVYRAVHKIMGRVVAIKTMQEARANDLPTRRRFEREVQVLAKLSHPNIVTAFDAREHDDVLYLVTELIEGEDLARLVARKGPLKPRDAMYFIWQAAKGLAYAHQQGIIHRDIKPSNLILEKKKTIKVLDLGLARLRQVDATRQDDSTLTDSGRVLGTARFMAPEQARAAVSADERADVYSLGCTLFYLLTGQPPFRGETEIDTILAHAQQPVPELPDVISGRVISVGLRDLLKSMMAKSPAERPQSMLDIVQQLESLIRQEQEPRPDTAVLLEHGDPGAAPQRSRLNEIAHDLRQPQRRQWLIGVAASAGGAAVLTGWYFWPRANHNPLVEAEPLMALGSRGLSFDGQAHYVSVDQFLRPATTPFLLQALVTPREQVGPANIISWTGEDWVALFMTPDHRWGLGWLYQGRSRLITTRESAELGRPAMVAGHCNGDTMQLFVQGNPVATDDLQYSLESTPLGLYIGGLPPEATPPNHGPRFFNGIIHAVSIDMGEQSLPVAKDTADLTRIQASTLVCFPFAEGTGEISTDLSANRYRAQIHGASWTGFEVP